MRESRTWAAILAGGDGQRLQAVTRSIAGDERPKQFCRLFGSLTLLAETRHRLSHNVEPGRTLYVVSRSHQRFYDGELAAVSRDLVIEQPENRGTTAAVAAALLRLRRLDRGDVIGFFPADHYYRDPGIFGSTVAGAYALAAANPQSLVLIGARATRAETEYGWIEPGPAARMNTGDAGEALVVRSVRSFHEKPSSDVARTLFTRGCLWNTLVVVGQIRTFEEVLAAAVPDVWCEFAPERAVLPFEDEETEFRRIYASVRSSDFSHEVLARQPDRLTVVELADAGWTDLGQPHRLLDVLAERHEVLDNHQQAG
jgi:mannose-1-phosphate guanylyltransferase